MTNEPIRLSHGNRVRHPNWSSPAFGQVFTEAGWAKERQVDIGRAIANAKARGGKLASVYWTQIPVDLLTPSARRQLEELWQQAQILPDGARVKIEDQIYAVRYRAGNTGQSPSAHVPLTLLPEALSKGTSQ